jgi:cytochrome c biogenesis protein CcmG, thiol:disulfide interchange protein DsbE
MRRAAAALALAACTACAGARPAARASPLVGRPIEIAAEDLGGALVRIDASGTVRVVDFWATWCDPCREQIPALARLASTYGEKGLDVYAVSFDEDKAQVQAFLARNPVTFAVLWDKGGARLAERLEVYRLPTTLVIDRAGVVRFAHVGYERTEAERLEREVRSLLGG